MIKRATNEDNILQYIGDNYGECLYLFLDYIKYGIDNPNVNIFVQTKDNNYTSVILKYYTGMHIYSKYKDIDYNELLQFIKKEKPSIICAEKSIINSLERKLKDYSVEYGWIRKISSIDEKFNSGKICTNLKDEDFRNVANLVLSDEIGESYTFDSFYNQVIERHKDGYGRNYIIKEKGEVLSHASTSAELNNIAVLSYVITNPKYRGKGYAKEVVGKLCYDLINEGKEVYLINYSYESTRLYDKIGFKPLKEIGKLVLKKKKK